MSEDRYFWQGVIRKMYHIGCAACRAEDEVQFSNLALAEDYWRKQGWHQRKGLWYCPDCGNAKEAPDA